MLGLSPPNRKLAQLSGGQRQRVAIVRNPGIYGCCLLAGLAEAESIVEDHRLQQGSNGSVVAARLAEDGNASILFLKAGGDDMNEPSGSLRNGQSISAHLGTRASLGNRRLV